MANGEQRESLEAAQLAALRSLLGSLRPSNAFYASRLEKAGLGADLPSLAAFRRQMPLTTKSELLEDQRQHPPYGSNLTFPLQRYCRFHQTSGSTGKPMRWLDTTESWRWMIGTWIRVFEAGGVTPGDRIFFPFSFGPFLGFWVAFDAATEMGCLAIPGGGTGSPGRLRLLLDNAATVLCCTPTYALHLAEVATAEGIDLGGSSIRLLVVAGEPGGGVEATRQRISEAWHGARVLDHHGMTEVGPVSFPNPEHAGILHINEESYLAEVLDPLHLSPVAPGEKGELILTTLGRTGSPLLRYRTGDLVRLSDRSAAELGVRDMALEGGILARTDDMVVVRGVNLYPSAVEQVLRQQAEVVEYRVELNRAGTMAELRIEIEATPGSDPKTLAARLERDLRDSFQLRIPVQCLGPGALPRFELKAKRWRVRE